MLCFTCVILALKSLMYFGGTLRSLSFELEDHLFDCGEHDLLLSYKLLDQLKVFAFAGAQSTERKICLLVVTLPHIDRLCI